MRKLFLLTLGILLITGCSILKNGVAEPKSLAERTLPTPHYDSLVYNTGWNAPYDVLTPWQKYFYREILEAKPDTSQPLPVSLRTYTIPVPTRK